MIRYGFLPSGSMLKWDIEKVCEYLCAAGYEGIELLPVWLLGEDKNDETRKRVLDAVLSNNLTISEVVLQRDLVVVDEAERADAVKWLSEAIAIVGQMGVDTVNLFTGPQPWLADPVVIGKDVSQGQAWGWVFAAFDQLLPIAEKNGVRIAVENVWGMLCCDLYSHTFLQAHYNSPLLGVNLDPSHDILYGNTDMSFLVKSWGDKIFHVHLKDAVGIPVQGKFVFPLLGEGLVNWTDFFAALHAIGYKGFASVEFESWDYLRNILNGKHEESVGLSMDAIRKLTEFLKETSADDQ